MKMYSDGINVFKQMLIPNLIEFETIFALIKNKKIKNIVNVPEKNLNFLFIP